MRYEKVSLARLDEFTGEAESTVVIGWTKATKEYPIHIRLDIHIDQRHGLAYR